VSKQPTGIRGLDSVTEGGLPALRSTLVAGTTGSGKTVFAAQFLAEGIRRFDQPGVFVTFEESPAAIRSNVASLGFDIAGWEAEGKWAFLDASTPLSEEVVVGDFDFSALIARLGHAVNAIGARRVALDSLGAVFTRFGEPVVVRRELTRLAAACSDLGTTSVLTAERVHEYNSVARYGVEEFVTDNVLILRNVGSEEKRRRTLEVVKFRGARHSSGEYSFAIVPDEGIEVVPAGLIREGVEASSDKISVGNPELDAMLGGCYRDAITVISGPSGVGKTVFTATFLRAGVEAGERSLLLSFEEDREHLFRNAASWGCDMAAMEGGGLLRLRTTYPELASLEDHFVAIRQLVEEYQPQRVAIDNLSALERISTERGLRDFIIGITALLRSRGISTLFTSTTASVSGGESATEARASTLTDAIVMLRYVQDGENIRRMVCVLKARGANHDRRTREFVIDDDGFHIGEPLAAPGLFGLAAAASLPMR
jgi:circadian clock protein KaiC